MTPEDQIAYIKLSVGRYFDGDKGKIRLWFKAPNPMLGGVAPEYMIGSGDAKKIDRLFEFVKEARELSEACRK